jgi:hypothetical protein
MWTIKWLSFSKYSLSYNSFVFAGIIADLLRVPGVLVSLDGSGLGVSCSEKNRCSFPVRGINNSDACCMTVLGIGNTVEATKGVEGIGIMAGLTAVAVGLIVFNAISDAVSDGSCEATGNPLFAYEAIIDRIGVDSSFGVTLPNISCEFNSGCCDDKVCESAVSVDAVDSGISVGNIFNVEFSDGADMSVASFDCSCRVSFCNLDTESVCKKGNDAGYVNAEYVDASFPLTDGIREDRTVAWGIMV